MAKSERTRIPKENKVRAELQKEIESVCPFCDNTEVGHFQVHHMDENPSNNVYNNLILLCPNCHSKITKGDIAQIDVFKRKIDLANGLVSKPKNDQKTINFNSKVGNAIVGDNNSITIKQPKKNVKSKYPDGSIGYDTIRANYVSYLIGQYNEYKEFEVGKGQVNYAVFSSHLKKQFKIGPTRTINNLPISQFEVLSEYIQSRIRGTKLAKIKGAGHKNYSTFEEYLAKIKNSQ